MYQISIRFDEDVMQKIKEKAQQEDRSIAYIVYRELKNQLLIGE